MLLSSANSLFVTSHTDTHYDITVVTFIWPSHNVIDESLFVRNTFFQLTAIKLLTLAEQRLMFSAKSFPNQFQFFFLKFCGVFLYIFIACVNIFISLFIVHQMKSHCADREIVNEAGNKQNILSLQYDSQSVQNRGH